MNCGFAPYEGPDNFIFASFCKEDALIVTPILERLYEAGFRVWYYDFSDPSAAQSVFSTHRHKCAAVLSFLSADAPHSHYLLRMISFGLFEQKSELTVYLEPIALSPIMQLQLSKTQRILAYEDPTFYETTARIANNPVILSSYCGNRQPLTPSPFVPMSGKPQRNRSDNKADLPDVLFLDPDKEQDDTTGTPSPAPEKKAAVPSGNAADGTQPKPPQTEPSDTTVPQQEITIPLSSGCSGYPSTKLLPPTYALMQISNGQHASAFERLTVGRSFDNDFIIADNVYIARHHAILLRSGAEFYLSDLHSINGTWVNDVCVNADASVKLQHGDKIRLANEDFLFLAPKDPALAEIVDCLQYRLVREDTGDSSVLSEALTTIGRTAANNLSFPQASYLGRHHADLLLRTGCCYITDRQSKNGTFVNGVKLESDVETRVMPGDIIQLADLSFRLCMDLLP